MHTLLTLAALFSLGTADARQPSLDSTISQVEGMVWDANVMRQAEAQGLSVVNVTWEDTGRSKNSALGPNISDMTIGVRDSSGALHPMPVFRFNNFTDKTADIPSDRFYLLTGNERGGALEAVGLDAVLQNPRSFLHDGSSWGSLERSLWDGRDEHVLVSAQACFLPVPKNGEATFTPVIYNYQSYPGNPAVLTMVATREGTSIQVVENDGGYMSEPLFFNQDGQRAPFTAERLSDWRAAGGDNTAELGSPELQVQDAMSNVVLVIQVPLEHTPRVSSWGEEIYDVLSDGMVAQLTRASADSDVEEAVIGHGQVEGRFKELNGLDVVRDFRFPVRVTVQFYQATSNGVVDEADIARIRAQIDRVYEDASYVGSLVTDGPTNRPTEWVDAPQQTTWADPYLGWLKAF